jgi:hypothetical protein
MANTMQFFSKIFKNLLTITIKKPVIVSKIGPNTLEELLVQFDQPKTIKTESQIVQDYLIKETINAYEVEYLRDCPVAMFKGAQRWYDRDGNLYFDWVPCSVRPEVVYCSYGKN